MILLLDAEKSPDEIQLLLKTLTKLRVEGNFFSLTQGAHENQQPAKGLMAKPSWDGQNQAKAAISAAAAGTVLGGAGQGAGIIGTAVGKEEVTRTRSCTQNPKEGPPKKL